MRRELLQSKTQLLINDFGAGGATGAVYSRSMGEIAKRAAKPSKYAQLLYRLCRHFRPQNMLELGTSLGISAAYQALGALESNSSINFITLEGSPEISAAARKNFDKLGLKKIIQNGTGNFDEILPQYLQKFERLDYIFFDGNHRRQPTLDYFNQCLPLAHNDTLFVFDDINWSAEMVQAWQEIKNHPQVTVTVDLFFIGLVFFRKEQVKQHFKLWY